MNTCNTQPRKVCSKLKLVRFLILTTISFREENILLDQCKCAVHKTYFGWDENLEQIDTFCLKPRNPFMMIVNLINLKRVNCKQLGHEIPSQNIYRPPTCPKILNCPKFCMFYFFVLICPNFSCLGKLLKLFNLSCHVFSQD